MKTSAPWRRLRAAAVLSPLVVAAALLAPASALAAAPVISPIGGNASTTGDAPETYTVTAKDPDDVLNAVNPGYNLTYAWTVDGTSVTSTGDATGTSSITVTPKHGHSTIAVTVTAAAIGLTDPGPETSPPSTLDVLANHPPTNPVITVPPGVRADIPVTITAAATDPDGDPITSWTWNLGDGVPHNTPVPSITTSFAASATPYVVSVNPHDSLGAESSASTPPFKVDNQPPVARLTVSPNPVGVGKTVTLSGTGSFDPEGGPLSYAWDLGSGSFGGWGTDPTTTTTFSTPGTQNVRLNVRDRYLATADPNFASVPVTVTARQPPAPSFAVVPAAPQTGQSVTFVSTTVAGESPVTALDWDLDGDGNFNNGSGSSVVASFSTTGAHTVSLRATDTDGTSAIAQKVVNVTAAPGTTPPTGSGAGTVTTIASSGSDPGKPIGNPPTGSGGTKAKTARLMSPFPKVRIRGVFFKTSVKLSFISVTARSGSTVKLKCAGHGCPKHKTETKKVPKGKRSVRFTKFPKALRKGATLRVYITRKGVIGKYTRFRIRVNKAPARLDACLPASGSTRPRKCPLPK